MAVRRRPPVSVMPPGELFIYDAADWESFEAWCAARREWVKAHPGSPLGNMLEWAKAHPDDFRLGGDVLDLLRERAAYRRGLLP